jgi:sigma-B regulation protein RsbU (phosphoserine phosphatase)
MVALGLIAAAISYWQATTRDAQRRIGTLLVATALMSVVFLPVAVRERLPVLNSDWSRVAYGAMAFVFPAAFTYVVLKDRVFGIAVIVRQGVKYALVSRGFLLVEVVALFVAFLYLGTQLLQYLNASASNVMLLAGTAVATLAIGTAVNNVNARVLARVDRRFFRDAYDAARILTDLATSVRLLVVEPDALVRTTVERIVAALHVERLAVLLCDPRVNAYRIACAHGATVGPELTAPLPIGAPFARYVEALDEPRDLFAAAAQEEIDRLLAASGDGRPDGAAAVLAALNLRLLIPLRSEGKVIGVLALGEKLSEEPYSSDDKRLLQSIADQVAIALRQAELIGQMLDQEKLRRDVEIAKQVQEQLLPQFQPSIPTLDVVASCRQARAVGGDYYDVLPLGDGKFALVIGDISGKGVSAALLMASLQALLRSRAPLSRDAPADLVGAVNTLLYASTAGNKYATLFYAVYDDASRTLTYVNAGHVSPLVARHANGSPEQALERLAIGGTVVGLFPEVSFEQGVIALHPGDVLIAFTDGVSEAMNRDDEELGELRLAELILGSTGKNATEIRDHIDAGTQAFVGGASQHDDLTLLVARVHGCAPS